jgi:hypothetical protein
MAMGKVYLPHHAPWVNGLVAELLRFPAGATDDQVDTLGLFGRMLDRMVRGDAPPPEEPDPYRRPTWNDVIEFGKVQRDTGGPQRI